MRLIIKPWMHPLSYSSPFYVRIYSMRNLHPLSTDPYVLIFGREEGEKGVDDSSKRAANVRTLDPPTFLPD